MDKQKSTKETILLVIWSLVLAIVAFFTFIFSKLFASFFLFAAGSVGSVFGTVVSYIPLVVIAIFWIRALIAFLRTNK